jgi:hypothetical protein
MFRKPLTRWQYGLISLAVLVGGVAFTYPGGWSQLTPDLWEYSQHQQVIDQGAQTAKELDKAIERSRVRYEILSIRLSQLAAGHVTIRDTARELNALYEGEAVILSLIQYRYPDVPAEELMAVWACHNAVKYSHSDERRIERIHAEFIREYGKPLPEMRNNFHMTQATRSPSGI